MTTQFSPREQQIYDLTLGGISVNDIAAKLIVKRSLVSTYNQRIAVKLGFTSVREWKRTL